MKEIRQYGPGIPLFFEFLRTISILFWIMAIISIPSLVSNITGDGLTYSYKQSEGTMIITSLAN